MPMERLINVPKPLNLVQEKAKIERSASQKQPSAPQPRAPPTIDLFGDDASPPPIRSSSASISVAKSQEPKPTTAHAAQLAKQGDGLLGIDMLGTGPASAPARPASASANSTGLASMSRPDLKQSILSLYSSSSSSKPQVPTSSGSHSISGSTLQPSNQTQDAFEGLTATLGDLDFSSSHGQNATPGPGTMNHPSHAIPSSVPAKSNPLAPQLSAPHPLDGGNFFDQQTKKQSPSNATPLMPNTTTSPDFSVDDDFSGFTQPELAPTQPAPRQPSISSAPSQEINSAFNLSATSNATTKAPPTQSSATSLQSSTNVANPWSNTNDSNAWTASDTTPVPTASKAPSVDIGKSPTHITPKDLSNAWGGLATSPQKSRQSVSVAADEDYGGWMSSSPQPVGASNNPKPAGSSFAGTSDPFDNPWG